MNYQYLVRDFAYRTRANLEILRHVQKAQPELEVYEVTQLINSMLGLLVFPKERYYADIPKTLLIELQEQGLPIPQVEGGYPQVRHLKELVRYLRNAITHCNLEFLSDDGEQISGLRVWNTDPQDGEITWMARLDIEDIEKITYHLLHILLKE